MVLFVLHAARLETVYVGPGGGVREGELIWGDADDGAVLLVEGEHVGGEGAADVVGDVGEVEGGV